MIELVHITKRFGGSTALDDVSLELRPGERLAVIGENGAGKSSLMNVLYGLYQPDGGEVRFDAQVTRLRTPAEAIARGVGMVHQHFTLVPTLTVAENVVLGHEPTRWGRLDLERARRDVAQTCRRLGFDLDPGAVVGDLSVGSQQKAEIVKALHRGVKTLILDEPTAVLTPQEADELFAVTRRLSEQGVTVVLISHKLKEVLSFATRIAVMRRGKKVAEVSAEHATRESLAALMVGQGVAIDVDFLPPAPSGATPRLVLNALSAKGLTNVSLEVRPGELLGIAGVDGNGQRELAEVLTGLRLWNAGTMHLEGQPVTSWNPAQARARGVVHIPEDRLRRALVAELTVEENTALGRQRLAPFAKGGAIDFAARRSATDALLTAHDVRPGDPQLRAGGLSGGNQQKLVVGRELEGAPKVIVAVQPTRGLDLAAVRGVRQQLLEKARGGAAVVLVSLDLEELLALSDRLLVMVSGSIVAELKRAEFDERRIGRQMLGVGVA